MFLNTFIQKDLFLFLATVVIERESKLNQLLGTIFTYTSMVCWSVKAEV